jgi:hypothetical protein
VGSGGGGAKLRVVLKKDKEELAEMETSKRGKVKCRTGDLEERSKKRKNRFFRKVR